MRLASGIVQPTEPVTGTSVEMVSGGREADATVVQGGVSNVNAGESKAPQAASRPPDRSGFPRQHYCFWGVRSPGAGTSLDNQQADRIGTPRHCPLYKARRQGLDQDFSGQAHYSKAC